MVRSVLRRMSRNESPSKIVVSCCTLTSRRARLHGIAALSGCVTRCRGGASQRTAVELTEETVRTHLASILPRHALPDRIAILDEMPRTSSGKIDRRALASLSANDS
jgi:acyl-CoA synthetase (AMP-forming)/AMP-acid ligase II